MENGSGNVSDVTGIGGLDIMHSGTASMAVKSGVSLPNGAVGDFIALHAQVNSGSDHFYYRFHRLDDASGAGTAYQVPNNYEFHVTKIIGSNGGVAVAYQFQIGTATASFTDANGTDPTGAKWQCGATSRYAQHMPTPSTSATLAVGSWEIPLMFDENLFPFLQSLGGGGGLTVTVIGRLKAKP